MIQKVTYPYEYMGSWKKFEKTKLPPKNVFKSKLNMKGISDSDHEYAQQVQNTMEGKSLVCYHSTYLKIGVLLWADIFENFENTCLVHYQLDTAHFYTGPGLA